MTGAIKRGVVLAVSSMLTAGCGGAPATNAGATTATATTIPSRSAPDPEAMAANQQGRRELAAPPQAIEIGPGLAPDPAVFRGMLGGPVDASTIGPECRGYITSEPTFTFRVMAPMPMLRVLVDAPADATLVVQREDGTLSCNDDSEGFNPVVQGPFQPGLVRIWVGAYSPDSNGTAFTLGLSERMTTTTTNMTGTDRAQPEFPIMMMPG